MACRELNLKMCLSSGVPIKIESYSDWCVYNDLFADGEYDPAIEAALLAAGDQMVVVDLGANVGFFTLRVLHLLAKFRALAKPDSTPNPRQVHFLLVEGSPSLAHELEERVSWSRSDICTIQFVTGLVGRKDGSGMLQVNCSQSRNYVGAGESNSAQVQVPYVDLDPLLAAFARIDLLKCDIEGSENLFLQNYQSLLRRTKTAIFEFHEPDCPASEAVPQLVNLGFDPGKLLHDGGNIQTWFFTRDRD